MIFNTGFGFNRDILIGERPDVDPGLLKIQDFDLDPDPVSTTSQPADPGKDSGFTIAGYNGFLVVVLLLVLIKILFNYFNK